jgi:hypothetical protein
MYPAPQIAKLVKEQSKSTAASLQPPLAHFQSMMASVQSLHQSQL